MANTPGADTEYPDRCARCGRPTPAGVSLCEEDNPGHIKAPSATQMHGTILVAVLFGFLLFIVGARFAVGGGGPFTATVEGRATLADGGIQIAVRVANGGRSTAPADCRVTRDGQPRPEDVDFRTTDIAPGATLDLDRTLLPVPDGEAPYDLQRLTVTCT